MKNYTRSPAFLSIWALIKPGSLFSQSLPCQKHHLSSFSTISSASLLPSSLYKPSSSRPIFSSSFHSSSILCSASNSSSSTSSSSSSSTLSPEHLIRKLTKQNRRMLISLALIGSSFLCYLIFPTETKTLGLAFLRVQRILRTTCVMTVDYVIELRRIRRETEISKNNPDHPFDRDAAMHNLHRRNALRLRDLFFENGGLYIKFGQQISQMEYLLPVEYPEAMKVMLNAAPISHFDEMRKMLASHLQINIEDHFREINPVPLASASLAQVHAAKLLDGSDVVIKIQHPFVQNTIAADIAVITKLLKFLHFCFEEFDYQWLAEETRRGLPLECDFRLEAINAERCSEMFASRPDIKIPKVYHHLSSSRILTMERVYGEMISNPSMLRSKGYSLSEVSQILQEIFSEMIFVHGFVHADPHPGNILVGESPEYPGHPQIILLDHGLYHSYDHAFRITYAKLWKSIVLADREGIKNCGEKLNIGELYPLFASMLTRKSWDKFESKSHEHLQMANDLVQERIELQQYAQEFSLQISEVLHRVPREMILLLKVNECLRTFDQILGTPLQSFMTTVEYCQSALVIEKKREFGNTYAIQLSCFADTQMITLRLFLAKIWIQMYSLLSKMNQVLHL